MGIIKVWELQLETGPSPRWRSTLKEEFTYHRTRVNEILHGNGQLWSASSDDTVQVHDDLPSTEKNVKPMPPITHPAAVRAVLPLSTTVIAEPYLLTGSGDIIRAYDVSSPDEPELLGETDAHWHDVIALRLWMRKTTIEGEPGKIKIEPWIVSTSLDGTLRRWRLAELLNPPPKPSIEEKPTVPLPEVKEEDDQFGMTEDEERELAELMDD
ncbi:hypothetical protein EW026_g6301 [Hermanssonia centrifuga]|uniref:Uncharacterized protein n=1 Tax=Hermanssonia centrifuga TaxID=98765 RepID=A0A4S4KBF4_9APHY|nr:hypothetical protein EW026_g6301 [Hermanssonia centrifuga]